MLQTIFVGISTAVDLCRLVLLAAADWWLGGALCRALDEAYEPEDQGWSPTTPARPG